MAVRAGEEAVREVPRRLGVEMVEAANEVDGVTFDRRHGAKCPFCGSMKARVTNTLPWMGNVRERYHKCRECDWTFKSVEEG